MHIFQSLFNVKYLKAGLCLIIIILLPAGGSLCYASYEGLEYFNQL